MDIKEVRRQRDLMPETSDKFLSISGWPLQPGELEAWIEYRQKLREPITKIGFNKYTLEIQG